MRSFVNWKRRAEVLLAYASKFRLPRNRQWDTIERWDFLIHMIDSMLRLCLVIRWCVLHRV